MAWGREEQRSMHEPYWLWQASVLPCANAPDAAITSDDVSNRKARFMDPPDVELPRPQLASARCDLHPSHAGMVRADG